MEFTSKHHPIKISRFFFSILILCISMTVHAQTINSEASKATFQIKNLRINTVEGSLTGMNGTINFSPDDLQNSNFNVCVDANTINTGIDKRDEHLKKDDFFGTANYPQICFESTSISSTNSGYSATGNLIMNGISKSVTIPFTFENNQFIGNMDLKRLDYNVGKGTGKFLVGGEVNVQIICTLN